jgi:hypothetical protein
MGQFIKKIIKWGGIPVGYVLQGIGIYYTAKDIVALGIPSWGWYLIGTVLLSASFISIIIGFHSENKEFKKALETGSYAREMEWRREYRKPQSRKVTNIPPTLNQIWKVVEKITEERKNRHVPKDKLLSMVVSLLNIPQNDPILEADNYTTEQKIKKLTKRLEGRMGLRKPDARLEAEWRKRMAEEMDSCNIGLQLDGCDEYIELMNQLDDDRVPITETKVDHVIDGFVENLHALYSIQLLLHYDGTKRKLHLFPSKMRYMLKHMEEGVERAMRGFLRQVNDTLEEYSIGKDLNKQR